ncbi:MAG TPA: carboxypeptidase regulatory-like domain-containing protein, partial [Candidatus Solibacter sp.]|nr:carboxypeptidase regulatory-like domain-containing protein [Candidatus Solibacter sp.]
MLVALALASLAHAQGVGTIVGTVTDPSGAVVSSATVLVKQSGTGQERSTATNAQGYYVVPSLPPSRYDVEVTAPGFRTFTQKNITLQADQSLTVNASLQVGAPDQSVTISADPPQVDTSTGALRQVVNEQRMVDMPLNGRNAATLTLLTAGTATTPANSVDQGSTKTFPAGITISTNGSRQSQISWNLDGGNNSDIQTNINQPFPFPDALQEFSVQTANYSAKYGMNAGGVVNVVTKSGTNQLHGSAFEFVRNSAFNARNYFAPEVDHLKRNQFGGTIGGPIRRDKTFFFFGYQGTTLRNTSSNQATVPTAANLKGDFTALLDANNPANPQHAVISVIDPTTGKAFPGNIIPLDRLDPAALALEKMLPQAGGNGQIRYVQPDSQMFNELLTRVDHQLTSHDRLTGRYFYDRFTAAAQFDPRNLLRYSDSSTIVSQNAVLSDTHVFSPTLLNEANLSYSRVGAGRMAPDGAPSMSSLGIKEYDAGLKAIQNVQVTGFFTIGSDPPSKFVRNGYRLRNDLTWIRGAHSFSFGGSVQRELYDVRNATNIPGDFRFNATNTKYAPAAFLIGQLNQLTQGSGQFFVNRNNFYGFYFQDDYHVSRRLTVNIGLRFEPFFPWHSLDGRVMEFDPAAYQQGTTSKVFTNAPKGLLFPGDPGVPKWGYNGAVKNFAPRLGFAWDVFGDGKTSVRGGAGMFDDTHLP